MKKGSSHKVYEYLLNSGILDNGTAEEIQNARREYWKIYKRNWRKSKRAQETEITCSFTDKEFDRIAKQAKLYKLSNPQFIKQAALAYIDKKYLVPNELEVRKISQLLSQYIDVITDQLEENKLKGDAGNRILNKLEELENQINNCLRNPQLIK